MNEIVQILLWPALACLVLTGIHAYLGLHVVERGVIFVDLSLAQVAALGATIAFLCGADLHGTTSYWVSLAFTLLGAAVFALTRSQKSKVPQEAIIGIVYAVCAAGAVLVMDRLPEGAEHIKYILVGNLLAVTPHEVIKMAILYSFIGLLHWFWRKPFLAISTNHDEAFETGYNVRLWDFLFYGTFGFVVTSSVAIAGVLLVFSFLIVPSVTAMLFSEKIGMRLAIGWVMGTAVSLLGMYGSYKLDAPTGATVVCTFGLSLLILAAVRPFVLRFLLVGLLVWVTGISVHAEELSLLIQGDAAYAKREDLPQAKIAMITYERAAASDPKVAAECFWKASRSAWWLGEHAQERAEKLQYFTDGMNFSKKAIALNADTVEAHFWLGANEGSYGDTKGVMKSLSMVKPIRHEMAEVIRLDDRYSGGGAYRVLGVVDYKVPGLMGGNKKRAKEELEKAYAIGLNNPFNYYYLAEFYKITGDDAKKKVELDALRTLQAPPDLVPELRMLQEKAEKELK